ncbi:unnamed protein product [Blepharisma stoltei]|uniref:Uncharacterized protein n=1 Tax=Blepharisma stoltei TaxID=1481888 RepID=A0AAU9JAP7_9CILI|nr:unnamed protein product [Blepharisma stoltei]
MGNECCSKRARMDDLEPNEKCLTDYDINIISQTSSRTKELDIMLGIENGLLCKNSNFDRGEKNQNTQWKIKNAFK